MQITFSKLFVKLLPARRASCFSTCAELSLHLFIKVLTTHDLKHLIQSGRPSRKELSEAWENIFSEYMLLSEGKQSNYLLSLLREYYSIPNKVLIIQTLVDNLTGRYDPELIRLMRIMGFRHKFDPNDPAGFQRDLKLSITQAKGLLLRYQTLQLDIKKTDAEAKKAEPADYDLILSELSKFQGYRLDPREVTVSEFCAIVKRFKLENKPKK